MKAIVKAPECKTLRSKSDVNQALWQSMLCQYSFINSLRHRILMYMRKIICCLTSIYRKQLQLIKHTKIEFCIRTPCSSNCKSCMEALKIHVLQTAMDLPPHSSLLSLYTVALELNQLIPNFSISYSIQLNKTLQLPLAFSAFLLMLHHMHITPFIAYAKQLLMSFRPYHQTSC